MNFHVGCWKCESWWIGARRVSSLSHDETRNPSIGRCALQNVHQCQNIWSLITFFFLAHLHAFPLIPSTVLVPTLCLLILVYCGGKLASFQNTVILKKKKKITPNYRFKLTALDETKAFVRKLLRSFGKREKRLFFFSDEAVHTRYHWRVPL